MPTEEQIFTKADIADLINTQEAVNYLAEQIELIRTGQDGQEYDKLLKVLNKLNRYRRYLRPVEKWGVRTRKASSLFNAYKAMIQASLELRRILATKFKLIEPYDTIQYAIYYKGKRYFLESLKPAYLRVTSAGNLNLNLRKAVNDITNYAQNAMTNDAINQHYGIYQTFIEKTYNGTIGKGGSLNYGHISQAFESHLSEHHTTIYQQWLKSQSQGANPITGENQIENLSKELQATTYWGEHEDPTVGWIHVRHTFGQLRGTVGGDVSQVQVKSAQGDSVDLQLMSLDTLRDGLKVFGPILDKENYPDSKIVAKNIIMYLTERPSNMSVNVINNITNENIDASLEKIINIEGIKESQYSVKVQKTMRGF